MSVLLVPALYLLAGALLCAVVHSLATALSGPDRRPLTAFAAMCLLGALASLSSVWAMQAAGSAEFLRALKWNLDSVILFILAFAAFIALYVGHTGRRARMMLGALAAADLSLIACNEARPYGLQYSRFEGITRWHLPWGESVSLGLGHSGAMMYAATAAFCSVYLYALLALFRLYRRTHELATLWLLAAIASFFPFALAGTLIRLSLLKGVAPAPFAFLIIVATMAAILAREAQRKLQVSERRFRVLFERSPDALVTLDPVGGRIVQANAVALELSGYGASELASKNLAELIAPQDMPTAMREFRELSSGRLDGLRTERCFVHKDGRVLVTDCAVSTLRDTGGEVVQLIAGVSDITERKRVEQALQRESAKNLAFLRNASDGIHILDAAGNVLEASESFCEMLGYPRAQVIGMNVAQWDALFTPEQLSAKIAEMLRNVRRTIFETRHRRRDGTVFEVEISSVAMSLHGVPVLFNSARDITQRKLTETQLRESEMRLRTLIEQSPVAISFCRDGITVDVNARYLQLFGYASVEEVRGTPLLQRIAPSCRTQVQRIIELRRAGQHAPAAYETVGLRKDGSEFPLFASVGRIELADGPLTLAFVLDFTERTAFEERIRHLALFDQLTRLPNRELLQDRLRQALASSARSGNYGAVLMVDLDNFKDVNDSRGHAAGDALLQQVATRLAAEVREGDSVARVNGDEFVVLLQDLGPHALAAAGQAEAFGLKIMQSLSGPYWLPDEEVNVSCSIGASVLAGHRQTIEEPIKQADIALHEAKKAGRNKLRFFDPRMQDRVNSRTALHAELRKAIAGSQFVLHYQLQVDDAARPIGAEALLRWNHPTRGLVLPAQFIGLAEEMQMILPIGRWVIEAACAQLRIWSDEAQTHGLTLAVNVSPLQFQQPGFTELVRQAIRRHGVPGRCLKLEVTETMLQGDLARTIRTMKALKEEGVQFSLDDFGTGYSSLQYLKRLPLDQLKIDRSFVRDIVTDPSDRAIVATIIAMARHLGLEVIAEGVETAGQLQALRECGCTQYQGYLFSRPVAPDLLFSTEAPPAQACKQLALAPDSTRTPHRS
jgi:diguanylate cyclase (GGDEF)-like protein/PAS domain S-box-containing protein